MAAAAIEPGELAKLEDVSPTTVSRWRRGEWLDELRLPGLARRLRVRLKWLKSGEPPRDEVEAVLRESIPEFGRYDAALLGISVDGVWCHCAFAKDRKFRFPLLSDFEPKGAVARQYGAYRQHEGVAERAAGGALLWNVDAVLPDGRIVASPTFELRLKER